MLLTASRPEETEGDVCRCIASDSAAYIALLKRCCTKKDLLGGVRLHACVLKQGFLQSSSHVADSLVIMYAKCGLLAKAVEMLLGLLSASTFAWNTVIACYVHRGQYQDVIDCYHHLQLNGLTPDAVTFISVLKACGSVGAENVGSYIHDEISRRGLLDGNIVLGNSLVDMYAKCGALAKAYELLKNLPLRNVITWNALIAGYSQHGQGEKALNCFKQMQCDGLSPNAVTFACILKACGSIGALGEGEQVHEQIYTQKLLGRDIVLGTALVDMYAKCGALIKAQKSLEELPFRNVITWTALIEGHVAQGQGEEALASFHLMQSEGLSPNAVTYICALKACGIIRAFEQGLQIHEKVFEQQLLQKDIALGNALLDMYVKCGALAKAHNLLKELPHRNVISWTALMEGYVQQGQGKNAVILFEQMQSEGISPNLVTYACILKACGNSRSLCEGLKVHDEMAKQRVLEKDSTLGVALVDMYAKCGAFKRAQEVLRDLCAEDILGWNALLEGFGQQSQCQDFFGCFEEIHNRGLSPNAFTFSCILNVCSHLGLVEESQVYISNMSCIHNIEPDLGHYACMVDCYGRAGCLGKAVAIIEKMPCLDYPAVWHTLLSACWKWQAVNIGKWAFEHAVQLNRSDEAAFVLMTNIYATAGTG